MAMLLIPAANSLTVSSRHAGGSRKGGRLTVGNEYRYIYDGYLFFDTSGIPNYIALLSAVLVLFKLDGFYDCSAVSFAVCPLLKQFSPFTTSGNACPAADDPELARDFFPFTHDAAVEIDITPIVEKWMTNSLINRGLVIKGNDHDPCLVCYASFGSAYSRDRSLIPLLRVMYRQGPYINFLTQNAIEYSAAIFPPRGR